MGEQEAVQSGSKKEQLHNDIKVSGRWLEALDACTFHGRHAADIATLRSFLQMQHNGAKKMLDEALEADAGKLKPEFGRKAAA